MIIKYCNRCGLRLVAPDKKSMNKLKKFHKNEDYCEWDNSLE